jgi:trehalose-6-phosphate synthase
MDARSLHDDAVVVDAHNDLPVLMLLRNARLGNHKVERYWHDVWVPEARDGGVDVQVLPIYCSPNVAEASLRQSLLQIEAVEREAALINERFGRAGWLPVDLRVDDDFPRSVAAYKQFDVLFVNAVFDGLNLVAKEAPLVNVRDGVVVLSENAGAYEELGKWALSVSPFDLVGQAEAIERALCMDAGERGQRAAAIRDQVRTHDVAAWLDALLTDFEHVSRNVRA